MIHSGKSVESVPILILYNGLLMKMFIFLFDFFLTMSGPLSRVYIIVKGRVQGVFFRVSAKEVATTFSLLGWVKNSSDGSVHICVEGPLSFIDEFTKWCKKGPSQSRIEEVKVTNQDYKGEFTSFKVI